MNTETNGTAATENAAENGAPVIPGREEVLNGLAAEVLKTSGDEPALETKVAEPKAKLPAEGEKPKNDLSKTEGQKTDEAGTAGAEPEWSAEKLAWFEKRTAAQTPEEIAAVDATAPEFEAEELAWLKAQETQPEPKAAGEDDHLADDAELKEKLDDATQERINKRIGKEVAKTKEAKAQLEAAVAEVEVLKGKLAAAPVNTAMPAAGPLDAVVDPAGLQKVAGEAEAALDQADDLLIRLDEDPAGVEAELRANKVVLKGADGTEDFSPAQMAKFLKGVKTSADKMLRREVPKRAKFLTDCDAYANEAMTVLPELKDKNSDRRKTFNTVLQNAPWLKQQAHWPRTAAIYALGVEQYMKMQTAKTPAGKPVAKAKRPMPTIIPSPRGQPPATPRTKPNAVTDETINSALSGNREDRLKYIQTLVPA